jgi:hypothetical protein
MMELAERDEYLFDSDGTPRRLGIHNWIYRLTPNRVTPELARVDRVHFFKKPDGSLGESVREDYDMREKMNALAKLRAVEKSKQ